MRQDIGFGMAGVGDGGDDIPCPDGPADFNSAARLGVGIKRYESSGSAAGIIMLNNDGLAEIVLENGPDHAVAHDRNAAGFTESTNPLGTVPVKAKIKAFMGKIPPAVITPPLVRGVEQHPLAKYPFLECAAIQIVGLDEHRAKPGIFQGDDFCGIRSR